MCLKFYAMNNFRLALVILVIVFSKLYCLAQPSNFEIDENKLQNCVPFIEIPMDLYEDIIESDNKQDNQLNRRVNYTIPVVFHIVHKDGPENVSDDQIYDALDILNEDFNAINDDIIGVPDTFKNIIGDANIEFQLVQQAPDGSCSNGINRYFSPYSEEQDIFWTDNGQLFLDSIKTAYYWDVDKYLNIYVVNKSNNSGIAAFPFQVEAQLNARKWLDGIMIRHYNLGTIGTATNNSLPHVLSHEAGHYFNLLHTWGNWRYPGSSELDWYDDCNQQDQNCPDFYCSSDDLVEDTPNCKGFDFPVCPNEFLNTCVDAINDLPDNTQNIMDYSCMIMFTQGQVQRMHQTLNSNIANRNNLWSEENLNYTLNCSGIAVSQPCQRIYSSYIRRFYAVAPNHGYLITDVNGTEIKVRYKINDGDWIELPTTNVHYYTFTEIEKCAKYQFQISEKCGDIFSPWSNDRFFFTDGSDVPTTSKNQFYTTVEKQDETAFNANDGSITINTINGIAPYTFNWSTGDTTSALNNIEPGEYFVTVSDSSGCSFTDTIVIDRLYCDGLQATIGHANQNYYNTANGNAEAMPYGGVSPYSYLWSNGSTNSEIDSLLPGEYWVVLTDSFKCQITDTVKIDPIDCSTLNTSFNIGDETTFGAYDGFIETETYGGVPPYSYSWSTKNTTTLIDNLTIGNYTLTTTDLIGCPVIDTLTVAAAYCKDLAINVLTTDLSYSAASNATASATAFGGKAPYTFNWSTGDTLQMTSGFSAGNYSVEVLDGNLCTTTVDFDVYKYDCSSFNVSFNTSNISYINSNDGAIQITTHTGFDPLQVLWSTGDTTSSISNLYAGDYSVEIMDSTGCTYTDTLFVSNVACDSLKLNINKTDQAYYNRNNGSISIEVENGMMPYNIDWSNGDSLLQLSNLRPGEYGFYFEDAVGCVVIDTIFIETLVCDSLEVAIDFIEESAVGANDATASASINNGIFPIQYQWSTGDTTATINSLAAGNYILNVNDDVGCQVSDTISIGNSYCDSLTIDVLTTILSDSNANDATATASVFGGTSPYAFNWSTGDTLASITNLSAGSYLVEVVDSKLCSTQASIDIYNYDCNNFNVNFNTSYISYVNANDGTLQITTHNGIDPLQIMWSTGDTTSQLNNLYAGDYSVEIIDSIGCIYTDTLFISNVDCDSLKLNITKTDQTYYNLKGGSISIEVENGIMPYSIDWSNGDNLLQLDNLSPGQYSFYFEDAAGCVAIDTISILPIICDDFEIAIDFEEENYNGANDATANVTAFNGTPPFRYYWSTGDRTSNIYNLAPAVYKVDVYDVNGCMATDSITINPHNCNNFDFQVEIENESYYNANDGTATIITDSLNAPYDFYWSTGDTLATITDLSPGVYYFLVSDKNGCGVSDSLVINAKDCSQFFVNVQIENATCSGENNGSVQLTGFENAVEPVQFYWNKDTLQNDSLLTGLSSGFYLFDAIDSNGCGFNAAFRVANETEMSVETFITPESWEGGNDGSVEAVVTGGNEPYQYLWSTGDTTNIVNDIGGGNYSLMVTDAANCTAIVDDLFVEILTLCPLSNTIMDTENLSSKTYQVVNFIESNSMIEIGENVTFKAGNFILLNNGFEVPKGADFSIEIEECE